MHGMAGREQNQGYLGAATMTENAFGILGRSTALFEPRTHSLVSSTRRGGVCFLRYTAKRPYSESIRLSSAEASGGRCWAAGRDRLEWSRWRVSIKRRFAVPRFRERSALDMASYRQPLAESVPAAAIQAHLADGPGYPDRLFRLCEGNRWFSHVSPQCCWVA